MFIPRRIHAYIQKLASSFPVVVITGPRQSGKTTLVRHIFPEAPYYNLEAPDTRNWLQDDPRDFLAHMGPCCILDEIQKLPDFLSYIQEAVDTDPLPGRFILTGSANLLLTESVNQSLAGRAAFVTLLPFDQDEARSYEQIETEQWSTVLKGGYPVLFDRDVDPADWLSNYISTYVERDVRQIINVKDLLTFQTFLGLCAGRSAGVLNLSSIASDCGITQPTAKAWLSVLESCYIVFRLPVYHPKVHRRLIKAPKLHFVDSGLLCYLLGIRTAEQLRLHPLRGAVFETYLASEVVKARRARGLTQGLSYYRDRRGLEVDLVVECETGLRLIEIKSASTINSDSATPLNKLEEILSRAEHSLPIEKLVFHGATQQQKRKGVSFLPWNKVHELLW